MIYTVEIAKDNGRNIEVKFKTLRAAQKRFQKVVDIKGCAWLFEGDSTLEYTDKGKVTDRSGKVLYNSFDI
jgi:hypothetical protein